MKITLEPTGKETNPTVTITVQEAGHITDVCEQLIKPALIAWGFSPETVDECIKTED